MKSALYNRRAWVAVEKNSYWQDVWANIWCAVLAVRWPVVNLVIVWLGPEVLLSLLPEISLGLYRNN